MTNGSFGESTGSLVGFVFWVEVPALITWVRDSIIAASSLFIFVCRQRRKPSSGSLEAVAIE